eukprot:TRINITY_DN3798_c0_g1_i1.p1 TRINITY_DN3798_c0_g1~~TRINITY_DN3798_c0_g1_i1.p1  ORF type:complete len:412 (-),score=50.09 TRINITY_DN3798_c0_g1_i1:18-1253(-)
MYSDDEETKPPTRCHRYWEFFVLVTFTVTNVIGQAMQIVVVVLWFATFVPALQGAVSFASLITTSVPPPIIFLIFMILRWLQKYRTFKRWQPWWYGLREFNLCLLIGILNALSQLLFFYSSDSTRTAAILQPILSSSTIFYSIPFTKWFLKDTKRYWALLPVLALATVLVGVGIGLIPGIMQIVQGSASFGGALYWPLIYLLSYAPVSAYNVMQQYMLLDFADRHKRRYPDIEALPRDYISETLYMVFWTTLWLLGGSFLFFWVDLIPGFGTSRNMAQFWESLSLGFDCAFDIYNQQAVCQGTILYTFLYAIGYLLSYWASARMNEMSANYTMLSQVCVSPLVVLFWLCFPWLNPTNQPQPLWSVLPALVLATVGLTMWRIWEIRCDKLAADPERKRLLVVEDLADSPSIQ